MEKRIEIEGMSCAHCVKRITGVLSEIEGVTKVEVNLKGKNALVTLGQEVEDALLQRAIEETGYKVSGITVKQLAVGKLR